ncbi:MAG: hypothetical protein ACYC40_01395 [Patescibacteria group bacterium]
MVRKPKNKVLYDKVRVLRQKGFSYGNIAKQCTTSKSNISLWCKDIKLSPLQYSKLAANKIEILKLGSKRLHEIRESEIAEVKKLAKKEINVRSVDDFSFFVAGCMLYWAEGCKTTGLAITNSDERVILFMIKWFKRFLNIDNDRIKVYLHIHNRDNDLEIKNYWSKLTGIPFQNFGKSFVKAPGTGHRKNILQHGIIRIQIHGKGTENLRHRIMTWVEQIYKLIIT